MRLSPAGSAPGQDLPCEPPDHRRLRAPPAATERRGRAPLPPQLVALALAGSLAAILATGLGAQAPSTVVGVVVDRESGEPVADLLVVVEGTALEAVTGPLGTFTLEAVPGGERSLLFRHLAYGEHARTLDLAEPVVEIEVRISREAIELAPLVVQGRSELEERRRASGNSISVIRFDEIQAAARTGMRLGDLLQRRMSGVRLRPEGAGTCLEYRLMGLGSGCRDMAIVMDGQLMSAPGALLFTMDLDELERLEVLSPGEAGARYGGAAAHGVLLIETRTGPLPTSAGSGAMGRFDWDAVETEPYPWGKVVGTTVALNAAVTVLSYLPAAWCTHAWEGSLQRRPRCQEATALGAGFIAMGIPGPAAGLMARRMGVTERSRGNLASMTLGTLTHFTGHLLFFHGRATGSGTLEVAGLATLALGTPLAVAAADRLFRALR